jgi:hypothetical protein
MYMCYIATSIRKRVIASRRNFSDSHLVVVVSVLLTRFVKVSEFVSEIGECR